MKKCCNNPSYAGTKLFDCCDNCGHVTNPDDPNDREILTNVNNYPKIEWNDITETLPKFEYVECDPILADSLVKAYENFIEISKKTMTNVSKCIDIIENGGLLDNRQKHLVYYHMKDIENTFGEFKNETVKEYLKDFIPEKQPWEK